MTNPINPDNESQSQEVVEFATGKKDPVLKNKSIARKTNAKTNRSQFTWRDPMIRLARAKERAVMVQNTETRSAANSPKCGIKGLFRPQS